MQRRNQVEVFLASLVVKQHLALDDRFDRIAVEYAFASHPSCRFQNVVRRASIAIGVNRDLLQQLARRGELQRLQAALQ